MKRSGKTLLPDLCGMLLLCTCIAACTRQHMAHLAPYHPDESPRTATHPDFSEDSDAYKLNAENVARLSAASSILSREDLIPCASLPARKLKTMTGQTFWLDGSWSNYVRPFIVKGSIRSGECRLEIHPTGKGNLNLGGRDAFVRGQQIRVLLAAPNGVSYYPPSNSGVVRCAEKNNRFEVSFDGFVLGSSPISYVMNESVPLETSKRVCLARVLDHSRKAIHEWVFIVPATETAALVPAEAESSRSE